MWLSFVLRSSGPNCQRGADLVCFFVQTNSRQQEGLSRFRDVKGKADQENVASSDMDVKRKKRQGETVPRDDAVNGRVVPIGSPFSLQASPLSKLPSAGLPGLYW